MGVLSDYMPRNQYRSSGSTEQVFCVKFEDCDINKCGLAYSIVFSLVTCKGSYIWGISFGGNATLLYAERNTCTIDLKLLPTPPHPGDSLFSNRPLMAICDTLSCVSCQWQVRFISLCNHKVVLSYSLESKALSVDANDRFVAVTRTDSISIFSALTLAECYTIAYVKSAVSSNLSLRSVLSLGVRWLAFADPKPVYQHLSRCGDASTDESQPLTTTVLSMNKRLWNGISALATSVVSTSLGSNSPSNNQIDSQHRVPRTSLSESSPQHGSSFTTSGANDSYTTVSPGYVTIVDLHTLNCEYETFSKLENDTASVHLYSVTSNNLGSSHQHINKDENAESSFPHNEHTYIKMSGVKYLNVHEFGGSGAIVAHFMAHRWASVGLLKFDPSGSLLFTACRRGYSFNLFRIANHPFDHRQTAVHHLYILERGNLPCEIMDATFSRDSRWVAVSSNHGTTHVFPITAYGGPITVRTHTRPHVVNRTSRYHRSSGLEEYHLTRPQPERSTTEPTGLSSNPTSSNINTPYHMSQSSSVKRSCVIRSQSSGFPSAVSRTTSSFCQTAPIAGFAPQCSHLGFTAFISPLKEGLDGCISKQNSIFGDSALSGVSLSKPLFMPLNPFSLETSSDHVHLTNSQNFLSDQPAIFLNNEGLCACPPNALYNTTNSRLPPYPEPCRVKAEARLKPSSGFSVTSIARGAATSAIEAVTPMTNINVGLVTSHSSFIKPCFSNPNIIHCPEVCTYTHSTAASSHSFYSHKHNRLQRNGQSLQSVDQDVSSSTNNSVRAARFGPPVCFLLNQLRLNNTSADYRSDPYVGKSRAVDALFILTEDLRLIEYDLCVSADDTATIGGKLYQDGSIHLDCVPVGEWNLHTDAVYLPPFPKQHPLILASSTLQSKFKTNKLKSDYTFNLSMDDHGEISSGADNNLLSTSSKTNSGKTIPTLKSNILSTNINYQMKSGLLEIKTNIGDKITKTRKKNNDDDDEDDHADDNVVTPSGWTVEDVASYWYSQVEITTHLGPLRRVWMGPQFTFHTYSKQCDRSGYDLRFSSFNGSLSDNNNSQICSTGKNLTTALHPTLLGAFTFNAPFILPPIIDMTSSSYTELLVKDRCPSSFVPSLDGSNNSLNMVPYHGSSTSSSSSVHHAFIHPHPQYHPNVALTAFNRNAATSKTIMLPRLPSGLLLDSNAGFNTTQLRWRNSSGEPTRPLSIAGGFGPIREPIVIEGGSYQDSSLGSSLSSLVGRGTDDLAQSIAEAIQDEETNWDTEKGSNNLQQLPTVSNRGVWQFSIKSTVPPGPTIFRPSSASVSGIPVHSILTEADFPSQDTSPSEIDNFSPKQESLESRNPQTKLNKIYKTKINQSSEIYHQHENLSPNTNEPTKIVKRKHSKKSKAKRHLSTVINDEFTPTANLYPSGYESLSSSPIIQNLCYNSENVSTYSLPGDLEVHMYSDNNTSYPRYNDEDTRASIETFQSDDKSPHHELEYTNEIVVNAVADENDDRQKIEHDDVNEG
ncbi:Breast carcinoma-amplified sequence 3 isoform 2 [Schistosoma japonicum]|uniref:Breast carcinoma-amplified sequence 3 isoform 2 n=2 Tax=Schistosoma japonicum TaxID=6182 RepID=A0A4Z2CNF3_SCHJA|nr:Breast carcinoma-amplified sequence 3 isoform 2 [Schistosoma japonicum]